MAAIPYGGNTENNPDTGQTPYHLVGERDAARASSFGFNHIHSQCLEASPSLPEYPQTRLSGYTYLIPLNPGRPRNHNRSLHGGNLPNHNEIIRRMQYSARLQSKHYGSSPYLNTGVSYYTFTCAGVKVCSNLDPRLMALHHTKATAGTLIEIDSILNPLDVIHEIRGNAKNKNAYKLYVNTCRLFTYGTPCSARNESCKPILKWPTEGTAGSSCPYICCVQVEPRFGHYHQSLANQPNTNFSLLEKFFKTEPNFECGVIESVKSRKPECSSCGSNGIMVHQPCEVKFTVIIPTDHFECPYILFVSHGVHTHPPTLPNKTPPDLVGDVQKLVHEFRVSPADSGLGSFILNTDLYLYLEDPSEKKIANLKECYLIYNRIQAFHDKERMVLYPRAKELNNLAAYSYCHPDLRSYFVFSCFNFRGTFLILACEEQNHLFQSVMSVKIEMNTRMLWNEHIGEVVITAFVPLYEKVMTLCRVFTNKQHGDGYKYIFEQIFEIVEVVTDMPFRFNHLHGSGLERITLKTDDGLSLEENERMADFLMPDGNLRLGLGRYLSSIDPQKRSVEWHIQDSGFIVVEDSPEEPSQITANTAEHMGANHGTNGAKFAGFNELDDSMLAAVLRARVHDTKDLDGRGLPEDSEIDNSHESDCMPGNKGKRRRVSSGSDLLDIYQDRQHRRTIDDLSIRTGLPNSEQPMPTIESQELYTTPAQRSSHAIDDFSVSPQPQRSQWADSERNRPRRVPPMKSLQEEHDGFEKRKKNWLNILKDTPAVLSMMSREAYIKYLRTTADSLEIQNKMVELQMPVPDLKTGDELWRIKPET